MLGVATIIDTMHFFQRILLSTAATAILQACKQACTHQYSDTISKTLKVTNLHEIPRHESLANVDVIISTGEICTRSAQVESVHYTCQLLSHVIGTLQRPEVDEVVIAPLRIIVVCAPQVINNNT